MNAPSSSERSPVYDFDFRADPHIVADVHAGYLRLMKTAPPVFWTPHHGGHWVANTATAVRKVLMHPNVFSNRFIPTLPARADTPRMIPLSLDPPEHAAYRQLLRPYFERHAVQSMAPRIEQWAEDLVAQIAATGRCDFVEEIGSHFPLKVFMELFGFPLDQFVYFRGLTVRFFSPSTSPDEQQLIAQEIQAILGGLIDARRAKPEDDLFSTLVHIDFEGRKLAQQELLSIGFVMFLAGLETVVSALAFGMRHLAHDSALRQRVIDDPDCIPAAVEELMRRYTFVAPPRYAVQDTDLEGARVRSGDTVLAPLMTISWDERTTSDPEAVSLDRPRCHHAAFGVGIHTCLGINLARLEMAIFYRVWFKRIGHFHEIESGEKPRMRPGLAMSMEGLHLGWEGSGNSVQ